MEEIQLTHAAFEKGIYEGTFEKLQNVSDSSFMVEWFKISGWSEIIIVNIKEE